MKKISLILAILAVSFIACNRGGSQSSASSAPVASSTSSGQSSASPAPAASSSSGSQPSARANYPTASESDFTVTLATDGTVIITGYTGRGGNFAVPATIQGIQVTEIGEEAFYSYWSMISNITGVQLPEGIRKIGDRAFYGSAITTITIPDSVTDFGSDLFGGSKISSFTFPQGLIASKKIPDSMFFQAFDLNSIVIPEGIEIIGYSAFCGCSLTSVTLPSTIKEIGRSAFRDCPELTNVIVPESVTSIRFDNTQYSGSFESSRNLSLAAQARLRELGYTGPF